MLGAVERSCRIPQPIGAPAGLWGD